MSVKITIVNPITYASREHKGDLQTRGRGNRHQSQVRVVVAPHAFAKWRAPLKFIVGKLHEKEVSAIVNRQAANDQEDDKDFIDVDRAEEVQKTSIPLPTCGRRTDPRPVTHGDLLSLMSAERP